MLGSLVEKIILPHLPKKFESIQHFLIPYFYKKYFLCRYAPGASEKSVFKLFCAENIIYFVELIT